MFIFRFSAHGGGYLASHPDPQSWHNTTLLVLSLATNGADAGTHPSIVEVIYAAHHKWQCGLSQYERAKILLEVGVLTG